MAEFSYIEYLNIPIKYKGSILHSYEYNATVEKINEIVDNLHFSYETSLNFPKFDETNDPLISQAQGTGVIINNTKSGKLYPVTNSSYVITGPETTLDMDLNSIRSNIVNNFSYLCEKLAEADSKIDNQNSYFETKLSELYNTINNDILETVIAYKNSLEGEIEEVSSYINEKISYVLSLINDVEYSAGLGITINDKTISVDTTTIVDNNTIYVNERGQLVVNKEVVLQDAEKNFTFINERGEWVGDMANVKNYIDDSVNTAYTYLKNDISDIYAYMTKFTEYEALHKNYQLSEEFINNN